MKTWTQHQKRIGKTLMALALRWSKGVNVSTHGTQKERDAAITALKGRKKTVDGKKSMRYIREQVEAAADELRNARRRARKLKTSTRSTPSNTMAQKLDKKRKQSILDLYISNYNTPSGSSGDVLVLLSDDPRTIGVSISQVDDRTTYRGSFKGWAHTTTTIKVSAPVHWAHRVQRRGIAVLDGMVTIDAAPMDGAPVGVDLFSAVWIVQKRGYHVEAVHGYIARIGGTAYHATTAEKALAGLKRKLAAA